MPRRNAQSHTEETASSPSASFHDYLARVVSDGYRLAVAVLDDPIEAGNVVREATMAAWLSAAKSSPAELDDAFRRRLDGDLQSAVRSARSGEGIPVISVESLEAALASIGPRLQVILARAFGPWDEIGTAGVGPKPRSKELAEAVRALHARLEARDAPVPPGGDVELELRDLYRARDPGEPAPLHLRLRLQQDLREAEAAAGERARLARRAGWRFVVNAFLAIVVVAMVVSLASILGVRSSPVAAGDPTSDPASPLTISGLSPVDAAVGGGEVHVVSTQRSFIVAFPASPQWRLSPRECDADIFGVLDWTGQATWIGQHAGHAVAIAGDPSSMSAYVSGLGQYCEAGRFASLDGGLTWSGGPLPGDGTTGPTWLSFDPRRAHLLLAYSPEVLYMSTDSGMSWTSRVSTVTPLAFDATGRLVGWSQGKLFESLDDGLSWQETGPGPTDAPVAAGANPRGVLIGAQDGLWWYPLSAAPSLVEAGGVFSIATLGDGAVVLGSDSNGHPWLGTVDAGLPGIALATLPRDLAGMQISGGGVAANDSGAVVAFSGASSALAFASFSR